MRLLKGLGFFWGGGNVIDLSHDKESGGLLCIR